MGIKVYYKSPVIWNMILYSLFSMAFIYFQAIYAKNATIMDKEFYFSFLKGHWPIILVILLLVTSLLQDFKKLGALLFIAIIGLTLSVTTYNLFVEFSKVPLILLFFYLIFGFYLYQFYISEKDESYYNPMFSSLDLYEPLNKEMAIDLIKDDQVISSGILTNWSHDGCFVKLNEVKSLSGSYLVHIKFQGHEFKEIAHLVSSTRKNEGHGFRFSKVYKDKSATSLGWAHFYEIIDEMGFKPELLK